MEVKILFLFLLYGTITLSSSGTVTLPFKDLRAPVKRIKPKILTNESSVRATTTPQLPKVPTNDTLLTYFKSQFNETDSSDIKYGFSSPLVLTTTSKPAPIPKIEDIKNIEESKIASNLNCNQPNSSKLSPTVDESSLDTEKNNSKRESNIPFPNLSSPFYKLRSTSPSLASKPQTYPNIFNNACPPLPYVSNKQMRSFTSFTNSDNLEITPHPVSLLPKITSLPYVTTEPLGSPIDSFKVLPTFTRIPPQLSVAQPYATSFVPQSKLSVSPLNKVSYTNIASLNPSYSIPYPLHYNKVSLPAVVTPSNPANVRPKCFGQSSTSFRDINCLNNHKLGQINGLLANSPSIFCENPYPYRFTPKLPSSLVKDTSYTGTSLRPSQSLQSSSNIHEFIPNTQTSFSLNPSCSSLEITLPETIPFDTLNSFQPDTSTYDINDFSRYEDILLNSYFSTEVDTALKEIDRTVCNDITNFQKNINLHLNRPEISAPKPCFKPTQEKPTDDIVPKISLLSKDYCTDKLGNMPVIPQINNTPLIPQTYSPPSTYLSVPRQPQTSIVPTTYINVTPPSPLCAATSRAVSSINNIVSDITENLLSSFMSYLSSLWKQQLGKPTNPYVSPNFKTNPIYPSIRMYPPNNSFPNRPIVPVLPEQINTQAISSFNSLSTPSNIILEPSFYSLPIPVMSTLPAVTNLATFSNDFSPTSFINYPPIIDVVSEQMTETSPLIPVKLTVLPATSFTDYSPLQPCPSDLPSPVIPSYLDISLSSEPQLTKFQNLAKSTKTINKLLKLVFLRDLLNGDIYVDWDALDTILSLLCRDKL